jgi:hypothetical protein
VAARAAVSLTLRVDLSNEIGCQSGACLGHFLRRHQGTDGSSGHLWASRARIGEVRPQHYKRLAGNVSRDINV